jgi:hypothetical protein
MGIGPDLLGNFSSRLTQESVRGHGNASTLGSLPEGRYEHRERRRLTNESTQGNLPGVQRAPRPIPLPIPFGCRCRHCGKRIKDERGLDMIPCYATCCTKVRHDTGHNRDPLLGGGLRCIPNSPGSWPSGQDLRCAWPTWQ